MHFRTSGSRSKYEAVLAPATCGFP
jgi:hypothetical protein